MSKYIMISMEDDSAKNLADVLGNKTAKKIIDLLAEKELSEADIAKELRIPINTAEYSIQKLVKAGLIEHAKAFFWSVKGKRIPVYKISNKSIIISPKKRINLFGLIGAIALTGFAALGIRSYELAQPALTREAATSMPSSTPVLSGSLNEAPNLISTAQTSLGSIALWFLGGALFSLILYLLIQKLKGGK